MNVAQATDQFFDRFSNERARNWWNQSILFHFCIDYWFFTSIVIQKCNKQKKSFSNKQYHECSYVISLFMCIYAVVFCVLRCYEWRERLWHYVWYFWAFLFILVVYLQYISVILKTQVLQKVDDNRQSGPPSDGFICLTSDQNISHDISFECI